MKIGIFPGSFNPIHHGHLMIASFMAEFADLDEVWFVVSPHNPLKIKQNLADEHHRFRMVQQAIAPFPRLKANDLEFQLPRPSYTASTLQALRTAYSEHSFSLIIGADNWNVFSQWKNHEEILLHHEIYIYKRENHPITISAELQNRIKTPNVPILEISSTFIRQSISDGKDIRSFVPQANWSYLSENKLYTNSKK